MRLIDCNNPILEEFRRIRTNIEISNLDEDIKVIMVTSCQANEGKSTFISNLAVSFSNLDSKDILLIDCDIRRPSINKIFCVSNHNGLSDILVKNEDIQSCIKSVDKLNIITAGSILSNSYEILTSKKMKKFLDDIRNDYDYIFIDTPPIFIAADAEIISCISDATILIIGCEEVDRDKVKLAKEKLESLNVNVLGAVVNKVRNSNNNNYY